MADSTSVGYVFNQDLREQSSPELTDTRVHIRRAIVVCCTQAVAMTILSVNKRFSLLRLVPLFFGLWVAHCTPTFAQKTAERFWIAGRYDGNRVVVYFDAVQFQGTMAPNARKIAPPVVQAFFEPVELPFTYVTQFQKKPDAEHFAIGDRYDLLLGNGIIRTIKLTTLVGCETDEAIGNDSYIGALGTVQDKDALLLTKGYFAVRRHEEAQSHTAKLPKTGAQSAKSAVLLDEPVPFDVEEKVMDLLNSRMKSETADAERKTIRNDSPELKVQSFQLADGSLRYYARAKWTSVKDSTGMSDYLLAAWLTPLPTLRILAVEKRTSPYGGINDGVPDLLNVVGLEEGKTGIIVNIRGGDSIELRLAYYQDGANVQEMPVIQSIGTGE